MRWFVDVSSVGKTTEKQRYCVDADSWQRALQAARTLRSDPGPMTGFSIELLDDGFSAVDPIKRQKYAIRKAPAEEPLTTDGVGRTAPPSERPPEPPPEEAPKSAPTATRSSRPPAPDLNLSPKGKSKSSTPPPVAVAIAVPPAREAPAPAEKPKVMPPKAPMPVAAAAPAGLEVLAKREQEPDGSKPLTYREYAYFVEGTPTNTESEAMLREQLALVQASITGANAGKLVNLALFNVRFSGRPASPPLATLAWKDWRGDPVVSFPEASGPYAPPPSARLSIDPAVVASTVAALSAPKAPRAPAVEPPRAAPAVSPAPIVPAPVVAAAPAIVPTPVVLAAPVTPPPTVVVAPDPPPPAPATVANATAAAAPPEEAPTSSKRTSNRPGPISTRTGATRGRLRGDELIADLFESTHELQFLRDAIEGADFCLSLALEKMPARGGIVHLYDIDRREYVITCAGGVGGETLLMTRSAENDPILSLAMRKRRAVVFADAQKSSEVRATLRYTVLGGASSLIVAPVAQGGRFLGALELLNPIDGAPFADEDGNALFYIAEQLASFVGARGILLDRGEPVPAGRSAGTR